MNSGMSKLPVFRNNPNKGIKKGQKKKCEKKTNDFAGRSKGIIPKPRKSLKYFNEYSHYAPYQLHKAPLGDPSIYVRSYPQSETFPVIDFSKNSHGISSLSATSKLSRSTSMRLIYKFNNFKARLQKYLSSSLFHFPVSRIDNNMRNAKSISNLTRCNREKLSVLEIPSEFYDEDIDGSECAFYDLSKADLNEEDRSMIECIAMKEDEHVSARYFESKQNRMLV